MKIFKRITVTLALLTLLTVSVQTTNVTNQSMDVQTFSGHNGDVPIGL